MTWRPAFSLAHREMVRFFRQRSRVLSAMVTPVLFWAVIGSGLGKSFHAPGSPEDVGPLEFLFPGTLLMIVLFAAIFATISIIEDRREGFLQSVLVAPVPRSAIVLGKMLGSTALAMVQVLPVLLFAPLAGLRMTIPAMGVASGMLVLVAFGLSGLGFLIAWRLDTVQGFHAIMMLLLMPMWMLSGAMFPQSSAPGWLCLIMALNPMTYALAATRRGMYLGSGRPEIIGAGVPPLGISLGISIAFAAVMLGLASYQARRTTSGDLH